MYPADESAGKRIRGAAIEQFGRRGFGVGLRSIASAAGVSAGLVVHHFGSKEGLCRACDDYVAERVRVQALAWLRADKPDLWYAQMVEMASYAPILAYLITSLESGREFARDLWCWMIDETERCIEERVRDGSLKPSRDPRSRARFLLIGCVGGLLVHFQLHQDATDLGALVREYCELMMLPALEVYTHGLIM